MRLMVLTMYEVLDEEKLQNSKTSARHRKQPLKGYNSALLLRGGTPLDLIPPDSEIKRIGDLWEVHMKIGNKTIVRRLAKKLKALGYIV